MQYHVTTRNFFAWIMGKPVVGPNPASALLALKLRMDVWRAPMSDNFAEVYHYARTQNYGELGDMQLFMTNHLRGLTATPAGYKLLPFTSQPVQTETQKAGLKRSLKKHLQSIQDLVTRRRHTFDGAGTFVVRTPAVPLADTETAIMSGGISPIGNAGLSASSLVPPGMLGPMRSTSAEYDRIPRPLSAHSSSKPSLLSRVGLKQDGRTYSMPALPKGSIEDVSRELEKQSSWMDMLTREHFNSSFPSSEYSKFTLAAQLGSSTPPLQPPPAPAVPRMSSHRRRASMSRPPSPIMEEDPSLHYPKPPPIPPLNERRFSTSAVSISRPSIADKNQDTVVQVRPSMIKQLSYQGTQPAVYHTIEDTSSSKCSHALLPSHQDPSCTTCGKRKLTATSGYAVPKRVLPIRSGPGRTMSLDIDRSSSPDLASWVKDTRSSLDLVRPPQVQEEARARPRDTTSLTTRFPSLKRRNQPKPVSDPTTAPPITPSDTVSFSRQRPAIYRTPGRNVSEPNIPLTTNNIAVRAVLPLSKVETGNALPSSQEKNGVNFTESPTELPTPVSAIDAAAGSSDSSDSSNSMPKTPEAFRSPTNVISLTAYGGRGLTSAIFSDPKSIDGHRIPMDGMMLRGGDTQVMDNILENIATAQHQEESSKALLARLEKQGMGGELKPDSHHRPASPPSSLRIHTQAREMLTKRLSNSLRLWSSKKSRTEEPIKSSPYLANILVMDSSGNFSTLASPTDSPIDFDDFFEQATERAKTPMCEMP